MGKSGCTANVTVVEELDPVVVTSEIAELRDRVEKAEGLIAYQEILMEKQGEKIKQQGQEIEKHGQHTTALMKEIVNAGFDLETMWEKLWPESRERSSINWGFRDSIIDENSNVSEQ